MSLRKARLSLLSLLCAQAESPLRLFVVLLSFLFSLAPRVTAYSQSERALPTQEIVSLCALGVLLILMFFFICFLDLHTQKEVSSAAEAVWNLSQARRLPAHGPLLPSSSSPLWAASSLCSPLCVWPPSTITLSWVSPRLVSLSTSSSFSAFWLVRCLSSSMPISARSVFAFAFVRQCRHSQCLWFSRVLSIWMTFPTTVGIRYVFTWVFRLTLLLSFFCSRFYLEHQHNCAASC